MIRFIYIFTGLVLLNSCNSSKNIIAKSDLNLELRVSDENYEECQTFETIFRIKKSVSDKYIFNIFNLSYGCNNTENTNFGIFRNIEEVVNKLNKNYFIIENENHNFKIFNENSSINRIELEDDCAFKFLNEINSNEIEGDFVKTSTIICKKDLLVSSKDEKIRILYLFNPDSLQKQNGYSKTLIKSNWVSINK